jgi:hypothetical protein
MLTLIRKLFNIYILKTSQQSEEIFMAKTPNYTDDQVSKMVEVYQANPSLDTVNQLVEDLGKNKASIISKLVSLGVYKKADKQAKASEPKVLKADVVADVQALFSQELPSLKNMTVVDLQHMAKELTSNS